MQYYAVEKGNKILHGQFLCVLLKLKVWSPVFQKINIKPSEAVQSPFRNAPHNLQEVLFVMGGRSLDDSDVEDEEEDGEQEIRIHPRNCAFYNTKLRKDRLTSDSLTLLDVKKHLTNYCMSSVIKKILYIVCSFHRAMASAT